MAADKHQTVSRAARLKVAASVARAADRAAPRPPPPPAPRDVRFPKDTGALRQHVAKLQARDAPPKSFPLRLPNPPTDEATDLTRPSAQLPRHAETAPPDPPEASRGLAANPLSVAPHYQSFQTAADIGALVRQVRVLRRLSQQELATAAGTGRRFISELEAGKATLEVGRLLAVCRALGIDLAAAGPLNG
jgi:y4mF family transcriptional regulator